MAFTLNKLADAPVIIFTEVPAGDAMDDLPDAIRATTQLLDQQPEPVFLIFDIRAVSLNLDDMIRAASMGARGVNPPLHHPKIVENVYVITDSMMKMALKGLASATFGFVKFSRFDTLDEALAYCRTKYISPASGMQDQSMAG